MKDKADKEREQRIKATEYKRQIDTLLNETKQSTTSDINEEKPNAITCDAKELRRLTEEYRVSKTAEEYKAVIESWLNNACIKLDEKLKQAAMKGYKSYTLDTLTIVNPGKLSDGKRCYSNWEFNKYLTGLIDPLVTFKEKVGAGISVVCNTCSGIYSGQEPYPDSPENVTFVYKFSW
jgi:hypothetical protein